MVNLFGLFGYVESFVAYRIERPNLSMTCFTAFCQIADVFVGAEDVDFGLGCSEVLVSMTMSLSVLDSSFFGWDMFSTRERRGDSVGGSSGMCEECKVSYVIVGRINHITGGM